MLKFRKSILTYKRDSYLKYRPEVCSSFTAIDCLSGCGQWGISPLAAQAHLSFKPTSLSSYPSDLLQLKQAILYRYRNFPLDSKDLFLGHGSFNLMERLIHKLLAVGIILGVGPQFNEIPSEYIAAGGQYYPVPINTLNFSFPLQELAHHLSTKKYTVLYIDNPNNPTGCHVSLSSMKLLIEIASSYNTVVIIDEAYADLLSDDESAIPLVVDYDNLIVVRSLSKCLGLAAARVGYMFMSSKIAALYKNLNVPFEPSLYSATVATATFYDEKFIELVRKKLRISKEKLSCTLSKTRRFLLVPTHPCVPIMTLKSLRNLNIVDEFNSLGIQVQPGMAFQSTHSSWSNQFCRLRIPSDEDTDECCRRIQNYYEEL